MGQKKRKPSWSSNGDDEEQGDSIFSHSPFMKGVFEYMNSPEAELQSEVDDVIWQLLEDVQVDAKKRLLLWPDAEQLTLDQSVGRLQKLYPDYPHELIEDSALGWLEMGYTPENYSVAQMDILDKQTAQWVKDHLCPSKKPKKP
jgi:hypothetical protein